ncbi:Envelope glycoprotein gp160 [Rhodotorula sphaerocarpa]
MRSSAGLRAAAGFLLLRAVLAADNTNTAVDSNGDRIIAGYIPVVWASVLGLVLYGASSAAQWVMWYRCNRRPYMLTLTIGMTCMAIGFILRIWYHGSPASLGAYIAQTMFLLLNMLLGRLAAAMGEEAEHCLLLPPRRIAKLFVWSDVVTFFMQAAGGGMTAASGSEMAKIGPKIALAGLALQLVSFSLFTVTLFLFGLCVRRKALYADLTTPFSWSEYRFWQREPVQDWRPLFCVLAVTCVGIIVRSTFRIVEYAGGYYGELATHEGYFYLLDALPLWLAMTLYCFFWPSRFIDGVREIYVENLGGELGLRNRRTPFSASQASDESSKRVLAAPAVLANPQNTAIAANGELILAGYVPSLALGVIGLVLFFLSTVVHWVYWARTLKRRYMLTLTISMACMTLGFVFRLAYRANDTNLGLYILMYLFLLLSPCAFLAMDYMLLSRLALAMGDEAVHCLILPATKIAKIFVWSDIVTFALQACGGGMSTSHSATSQRIGPKITLAGLSIQLASFSFFTCTLLVFGWRLLRRPAYSNPPQPFTFKGYKFWSSSRIYDWRPVFFVLALTCIGILIRSVFRIIEFAGGYYGKVATTEGYFYGLDALPLWLAMTLYCFFWPVRFIDGAREVYRDPAANSSGTGAADEESLEKVARVGPNGTKEGQQESTPQAS